MKCRGGLAEGGCQRQHQGHLGELCGGASLGPQVPRYCGCKMPGIFGEPAIQFLSQPFEVPASAAIKPRKINPARILMDNVGV